LEIPFAATAQRPRREQGDILYSPCQAFFILI
jgi:hypothetical protein